MPFAPLRSPTSLFLALLSAIALSKAAAQDPYLVKDINATLKGTNSDPKAFCVVGSLTYFTATTPATGIELWKTDGTPEGTTLVKEIIPGITGAEPQHLTAVGSALFFTATNGSDGRELWKTDGTEAGTVMVKDIHATPGSASYPASLTAMNGVLYFQASDGINGAELWKSDGTSAGTTMVKNIDYNSGSSTPTNMVVLGSTLFFQATKADFGAELWKTDGTEAGTTMVKDIRWGSTGSTPSELIVAGSVLYFRANDGSTGDELWKSDGTEAGTVMVKDIFTLGGPTGYPSTGSSYPSNFAVLNNVLYFNALNSSSTYELWRSDGTSAGTRMVWDLSSAGRPSLPVELTTMGNAIYFSAKTAAHGIELWKTVGTEAGTTLVKNILADKESSSPSHFRAVGNTLYFFASGSSVYNSELWKSDGTAAGTVMVKSGTSRSAGLAVLGSSTVYFQAEDGIHGCELWSSNGTTEGTAMVKNINPATDNARPSQFATLGDQFIFTASDGIHGNELWKSDGTAAGTTMVKDLYPGSNNSSYPADFILYDNTLYFTASSKYTSLELWKTDGTAQGTVMVKDLFLYVPQMSESTPNVRHAPWDFSRLTIVDGQLYFTAITSTGATELWKTDGTAEGIQLIKSIPRGSTFQPKAVGNTLYFQGYSAEHGHELWKSDGTAAGTLMVKDIYPGQAQGLVAHSHPLHLTQVGSTLYFVANDGINGRTLWKSDGTAEGTTIVKLITSPGKTLADVYNLVELNGTLYFAADYGCTVQRELWRSDGTAAGTTMVSPLSRKPDWTSFTNITAGIDRLYFSNKDDTHGEELWTSDGTAEGTFIVKDITPGTAGSGAYNITTAGDHIYFLTSTSAGNSIWRSDGTADGTVQITAMIRPPTSAVIYLGGTIPPLIKIAADCLYFSSVTYQEGLELWAQPITLSPPKAITGLASALATTSATLHGSVNGKGLSTTARFQYGSTPSYGNTAEVSLTPGQSLATLSVSAPLIGLTPNTAYHYRLVAQNYSHLVEGASGTFTTLPQGSSPIGGTLTLTPSTTVDPNTPLTVTFAQWTDDQLQPLTYSVLVNQTHISAPHSSTTHHFASPSTPGTYTLKGRIHDQHNNVSEVITTLTVNTPLQSWRKTHFGTSTFSDLHADTADFDHDGIPNLLEWATGLNPTSVSQLPATSTFNSLTGNLEYTYTRSLSAVNAGATYTVQWSDTLLPGSWSTTAVTQEVISSTPSTQTVKTTLPAGTLGRRFVHLRVTAP